MSFLDNTPRSELVLRLAARKSFSFGIVITDEIGRSLDITGSTIRLTIADNDNVPTEVLADLVTPTAGYARVNLQASQLAIPEGEYPFVLTIVDEGYSSPIAAGTVAIIDNPDTASVSESYAGTPPVTQLNIALRDKAIVHVNAGAILPPGIATFTDADRAKLDGIEDGALRHPNVNLQLGEVTLDMDDFADTATRIAMTPAERTKLAALVPGAATWAELTGKPDFGTASLEDVEAFLPAAGIDGNKIISGTVAAARLPKLSGLTGFSSGTGVPSGGVDGDLYFQYTP